MMILKRVPQHLLFTALLSSSVAVSTSESIGQQVKQNPPAGLPAVGPSFFVEDEVVVEFAGFTKQVMQLVGSPEKGQTGLQSFDQFLAARGVDGMRRQFEGDALRGKLNAGLPDLSGYYVVSFDPERTSLNDFIVDLANQAEVKRVEPIGVHPVHAVPNDTYYSYQWHLNQSSDRDIDAPEAWDQHSGDDSVVVAILDTGVRYYHGDLGGSSAAAGNPSSVGGNIWTNASEQNGTNGIDDDGNGYVDDAIGWDFVSSTSQCWSGEDCSGEDNDPRDFNGHGTHCAGIVAAINNNGYSVSSPAGGWGNGSFSSSGNGAKIMCLRIGYSGSYFGSEVGYVRMDAAASAFYYAANNGANIANCSWGSSNSGGLGAAVDYFINNGGLVFVAAGNDGSQNADYMASRNDVFAVAATDSSDRKASFSTYGTWVDISAPGVTIYSTYHDHNDASSDYVAGLDGTSMATPLVCGVAAAVWGAEPSWTASQVWAQVRDNTDNIDALNSSYVGRLGSGRVNLYKAVDGLGVTADPTGACCTGSTCSVTTQAGCAGSWLGAGTNCSSDPCAPTGACCSGSSCSVTTQVACTGSWLGAGTNCSSDPCAPTGACCTGSSCSITTASDCNGNYLGDGTSCAADPCAPPDPTGACCTGSSCSVTTEASCSGTYLGDGSDCGTDPCAPTGACCVGTSCSVVKESECSGAWQGANTDCASDPCAAPTGSTLLMAFRGNPTINGRRYKDEDIMSYDPTNGETSVYFDGSDVGFASGRIHAFCLLPDGDILISPHKAMTIPGLSGGPSGESVDDSDIIRFSPTNLGGATSGSWSFYFDGSDVGLTTNGEDIDGLSVLSDGALLISTVGSPGVTGLSSLKDEDIVRFDASALGASTGGSWSYYMDGSDVGLSADKYHDVDALTVLTEGIISLSTLGNYNVGSIAGGDEDVIDFAVTSFGSSTSGSFSLLFDGSADLSLPSNADILGLHEVGAP